MITTKVVIQLPTHTAHVQVDDRGVIQVFKYTQSNCDFAIFDHGSNLDASDYITEPLPRTFMRIVVNGEDDCAY
jgi:hypothetical protein